MFFLYFASLENENDLVKVITVGFFFQLTYIYIMSLNYNTIKKKQFPQVMLKTCEKNIELKNCFHFNLLSSIIPLDVSILYRWVRFVMSTLQNMKSNIKIAGKNMNRISYLCSTVYTYHIHRIHCEQKIYNT